MPSRLIEDLHPILQPLCRDFLARCAADGIPAFITQTYRSSVEQDTLYAQGRTAPGRIVTQAKGGQSKHNATLNGNPASRAFDAGLKNADGSINWNDKDPAWKRMGDIGKSLGLIWGGDWLHPKTDLPHFELPTNL